MVRLSYRRYLAIICILMCLFVCAGILHASYRFRMLMLLLKKYAYSSLTYTLMLAVIVIQWHILVNGFFHNVFEGDCDEIELSLTTFILADFAAASVLITFGAILGKVTKPAELVLITLSEVISTQSTKKSGRCFISLTLEVRWSFMLLGYTSDSVLAMYSPPLKLNLTRTTLQTIPAMSSPWSVLFSCGYSGHHSTAPLPDLMIKSARSSTLHWY
jgi:hypothetical protein